MENIENDTYKEDTIKGFNDQLEEIEISIISLDPRYGKEKLKNYSKNMQSVAISNDIVDVATKAYWDKLTDDIKNNNFEILVFFD